MLGRKVFLFSFPFFYGTLVDFEKVLLDRLSESDGQPPTVVYTPNAEQIIIAQKDSNFRFLLQHATYNIPDGAFVVLASRLLTNTPFPERISGVDVVEGLVTKIDHQKMLIIGGRYAGQSDILWIEGYQDVLHTTEKEEKEITLAIKKHKPEVLFVAFGAPSQEKFIFDHYGLLSQQGIKIVMAVGGSFDFLFGKVKRAPIWMQRSGLEWFFRLIQEPWRWKRQLRLFEFAWLLLRTSASQLLRRLFFTEVHA